MTDKEQSERMQRLMAVQDEICKDFRDSLVDTEDSAYQAEIQKLLAEEGN